MLFPYLKAQLGVGYIELGFALTVFGLVSGLTQAPIGYLADHIGARKVLLIGLCCRRARADHARHASELHVADRLRRAARARQQRLSPLRLRDPVGAYGCKADGPRVFDPHVCGLPRRRGGACDHGSTGGVARRPRRADRGRRGRPCGGAAVDRRRHSRCELGRSQGRWRGGAAAKRHHAGDHHADVLLHAAGPLQRRHQQFRRGRADERLWRDLLGRQYRADGVSRRQRGGRAGRRLSRRPHHAPRPGRRRLLWRSTPSSCW